MATKRVYVYKKHGLIDDYRVFPPVIVLDHNDKFQLVNTADHDAFLTIPDDPFEGGPVKDEKIAESPSRAENSPRPAPSAWSTRSRSTERKRRGNSDPVIIIEMPERHGCPVPPAIRTRSWPRVFLAARGTRRS